MHITVLRMGGAAAGIMGSSGADNDIVNNLKKCAIAFAYEYRKPTPANDELLRLSQEINGYLHVLQLTSALSEKEFNLLVDYLQALTANPSS